MIPSDNLQTITNTYAYIRRPLGVWGSKIEWLRFELRSETKSDAKRSESEAKARRKGKRRIAKLLTKPGKNTWEGPDRHKGL